MTIGAITPPAIPPDDYAENSALLPEESVEFAENSALSPPAIPADDYDPIKPERRKDRSIY